MRVFLILGAAVALASSVGADAHPNGLSPVVAGKRCPSGSVHAVIARRHRCLRAGQQCLRRLDRQYHRYGFHCHSSRLTRASGRPPSRPRGVLEVIRTPAEAWDMAIGSGALWVQVGEVGAVRIDRTTKRVTARVEGVGSLAFLGAELWAAAIDRVLQLDPASGAVLATIPVGAERAWHIAVGGDALWLSGGGTITRIDPVAKRVTAAIAVPTCAGQRALAFGHGGVWVGCKDAGVVVRIDPATNAVVATIRTGPGAHHLAIGENAVWVTNYEENTVSRIDPSTNAVLAKIRGVGSGVGIAAGAGRVWAATPLGIAKIDPGTNAVRSHIRLEPARFHYDIQFAEGSLWVSSTAGRIYRIDPNA